MDRLRSLLEPDRLAQVLATTLLLVSAPLSAVAAALANLSGGVIWSAAVAASALILLIGGFGFKTVSCHLHLFV
jgi:hypothetical protein